MAKATKSSPPPAKSTPPKKAEEARAAADELTSQLVATRNDLMRAQRDLETVRLEMVEQKRKSSQHSLVHSEELKAARRERDILRVQLDALRAEMAQPAARRKKRDDDDKPSEMEKELADAREEAESLRAQMSQMKKAQGDLQSVLAAARRELDSRPPPPSIPAPVRSSTMDSTPPPIAPVAHSPAAAPVAHAPLPSTESSPPAGAVQPAESAPPAGSAEPQRGFFSRIFGRKASTT
jgi:hypothetical protein